ncbi:MAG: hypothetical protein H6739_15425 [Alphaproteobacteria bacterium]|nr:hypothetical protein [Alphaproteobacteria bacterium]
MSRRLLGRLLGRPTPPPSSGDDPPAVQDRLDSAALGLPDHATVRCLLPLPDGGLALGSDYGLTLWREGQLTPFPFPQGARRESRRVEAMAVFDGTLHVGTQTSFYTWPFHGEAAGRGRPRDGAGGYDDLRALFATPDRLLQGWRTHLEGGEGPPECLCFAAGWGGAVFAGTLDGALWQVDGAEVRRFERDGRGRPVRHLAFAHGALWVAAAGGLHRWDGAAWQTRGGEPYALHADPGGTLWALEAGRLWRSTDGGWPRPLPLRFARPWALGSTPGRLWIGRKGGALAVAPNALP